MANRKILDIISKARERNARWLNLSNLSLEELPPEIGQLTELRVLWIACNNLTRLPEEIGRLRKLKRLRLEGNALAELPPEIGLLTELEELQLHKNQLHRLPQEFWRLANLKRLTLAGNLLGELPVEIGQFKALEELKLGGYWEKVGSERYWSGGNQIKHLPPEIAQLSNLRYLSVYNNQLTALPLEIAQLSNLQSLDVYKNQLTALPPEIAQLSNLQFLSVSKNQLTALPPEIAQLSNLQSLFVWGNQLTALPPEIAQLSNLQSLDVWGNQLTALPPEIAQLSNLQSLSVWGNQLTALPPEIAQLSNLQSLDVSYNQLTALPPEIAQLSNLQSLDVSYNQLTALPPEIAQLSNLQFLSVSKNQLTALPPEIAQLSNLQSLSVSKNQLTALPPEIAQLSNLQSLEVWGNQLTALPLEIAQLSNLQYLSVSKNQLTALPPEIAQLSNLQQFDIFGNEKLKFPPEIIEEGTEAILDFLRRHPEPQWVSKMLVVGQGGVGKTCLLRALRGDEFIKGLKTTHGIETDMLCLAHPDSPEIKMRLNTWDFGGQQIYHATHQFFLTNRSLYVLVWNARIGFEQCKLYYWLDMITARAPQSPIMIVATHTDERRPGLPFAEIRQNYPNVLDEHFEVSNETGDGIERLRQVVAKEAAALSLMGEPWPPDWIKVKVALRKKASRRKYITPAELEDVMSKYNVTGFEKRVLTRFLHELGEIIYFGDRAELKDTVILHSQWATQAISKVLESKEVEKGLGLFKRDHMDKLWRAIESGMREYMLNLMEQFDLSYRTLNDRDISIVVERLAYDPPPECHEKWKGVPQPNREISMRFVLDKTMPAGVPTWFIARQHRFTTNTHWRYGALFEYHDKRHWGLIEAYPHDRYLRLAVRGPAPQDFFALLRDGLELTLRRFEGLGVTKLVPCPGHDGKPCGYEFDYEHLKKRIERTPPRNEIECPLGEDNVYVPRMLYGLHPDTTYQMLSRKLDEVRAGVDYKLEEALGDLRYLQRELTKHYNALQRAEEASCPYVFVMRGGTYDGDLIGLFGPIGSHGMLDSLRETVWKRRVELQLYCQQPGCWHPVGYERGKDDPATGLYQIEIGSDFLKLVAPHLTRIAKLFKFAQPLLGAWVSWAEPEKYAKQFKEDLERMKKIADQVGPAVEDSHEAKRAGALVESRDPREANGALLRALKRLLDEKDKTGAWGGLTRKLTKEGHYLWLCRTHAEEYLD